MRTFSSESEKLYLSRGKLCKTKKQSKKLNFDGTSANSNSSHAIHASRPWMISKLTLFLQPLTEICLFVLIIYSSRIYSLSNSGQFCILRAVWQLYLLATVLISYTSCMFWFSDFLFWNICLLVASWLHRNQTASSFISANVQRRDARLRAGEELFKPPLICEANGSSVHLFTVFLLLLLSGD